MRAPQPGRRVQSNQPATIVRRSSGSVADELFVLCRPAAGIADPGGQVDSVYAALGDALAAEGVDPAAVDRETVFLRRVRADASAARAARNRVFAGLYRPATTCIGQPPLDGDADVLIAAVAVVPRHGVASSVTEATQAVACGCEACAPGLRARIVRLGDQATLHAGNVHGSGRDAVAEAYDMFRVGDALLRAAGMTFRNVIRTWIHLRDIGRDYAALNEARRRFFTDHAIEQRPASTGIQGSPFPDAHRFSLSLQAATSAAALAVTSMSAPSLNEAWTYGADFSRGLRVAGANGTTLHLSGTASIDEDGHTVHVGCFEAQAERMLHNVGALLAEQGASVAQLVSAVTYLRHAADAPVLRALFDRHGFGGFPCAVVEGPLCRPELLCETEAVAILPAQA